MSTALSPESWKCESRSISSLDAVRMTYLSHKYFKIKQEVIILKYLTANSSTLANYSGFLNCRFYSFYII